MKNQNFTKTMENLEILSKNNPIRYKLNLIVLSLFRYSYIFTILFFSGLLIFLIYYILNNVSNTISGSLVFPLFVLLFIINKTLWIKIQKPGGIILTRDENNNIYNLVKEIQQKMKSKKIHQIILNDNLDISIIQRPRLGTLGFYKNYLIIGLPILMALNENELKCIIAHELGHLSDRYGRFNFYLYRIKNTLYQIMISLEENKQKLLWVYKKFINVYLSIFETQTFLMIRKYECKVDLAVSNITDNNTFGSALLKLNIVSNYLDNIFSKNIYDLAKNHTEPIYYVYNEMYTDLTQHIDETLINKYKKITLNKKSSYMDTHPSLKERLTLIGANTNIDINFDKDSLSSLFINKNLYINICNEHWKLNVSNWWNNAYDEYHKAKLKLEHMESDDALDINLLFEKANLIEEFRDDKHALEVHNKILESNEAFSPSLFSVGRILLDNNNKEGIEFINRAIKTDQRYTIEGYSLIYDYYLNQGEFTLADKYYSEAEKHGKIVELANIERKHVKFNEKYCEHNLTFKEIEDIQRQIKDYNKYIEKVYLIRKDVQYLKDFPLYILGIKFSKLSLKQQKHFTNDLANKIKLPGEFFIVPLYNKNKEFEVIMENIDDSIIIPN